ncbi:Transcriptional regulator PadR-like family protein [compost metagenome]
MQLQAKFVLLGLLSNGPKTGYEMKKTFEEDFSFFFDASYGSVYPSLKKLEQEGMVLKTLVVQEDRPNKQEFSLTPEGEEAFKQYLESELAPDSIRSDLCMRLYFGALTDDQRLISWMEAGMQNSLDTIAALRQAYIQCEDVISPSQRIVINLGINQQQALYDSLKDGLEQIRKSE